MPAPGEPDPTQRKSAIEGPRLPGENQGQGSELISSTMTATEEEQRLATAAPEILSPSGKRSSLLARALTHTRPTQASPSPRLITGREARQRMVRARQNAGRPKRERLRRKNRRDGSKRVGANGGTFGLTPTHALTSEPSCPREGEGKKTVHNAFVIIVPPPTGGEADNNHIVNTEGVAQEEENNNIVNTESVAQEEENNNIVNTEGVAQEEENNNNVDTEGVAQEEENNHIVNTEDNVSGTVNRETKRCRATGVGTQVLNENAPHPPAQTRTSQNICGRSAHTRKLDASALSTHENPSPARTRATSGGRTHTHTLGVSVVSKHNPPSAAKTRADGIVLGGLRNTNLRTDSSAKVLSEYEYGKNNISFPREKTKREHENTMNENEGNENAMSKNGSMDTTNANTKQTRASSNVLYGGAGAPLINGPTRFVLAAPDPIIPPKLKSFSSQGLFEFRCQWESYLIQLESVAQTTGTMIHRTNIIMCVPSRLRSCFLQLELGFDIPDPFNPVQIEAAHDFVLGLGKYAETACAFMPEILEEALGNLGMRADIESSMERVLDFKHRYDDLKRRARIEFRKESITIKYLLAGIYPLRLKQRMAAFFKMGTEEHFQASQHLHLFWRLLMRLGKEDQNMARILRLTPNDSVVTDRLEEVTRHDHCSTDIERTAQQQSDEHFENQRDR